MDARPADINDDEISLMDIYDFLRDGWWTLVGLSVLGLVIGIIVSFVFPVKYQASALLDSGKVGFYTRDQGVVSREVEPVATLAERMKLPGFYSPQSLAACGLESSPSAGAALAGALSPNVARNSKFVTLTYQSDSPEVAKACLQAVLSDVIREQSVAFEVARQTLQTDAVQLAEEIDRLRLERVRVASAREGGLKATNEQLDATRESLRKLDEKVFSENTTADAAGVLMLLTLRNYLKELETMVVALQASLNRESLGIGAELPMLTERLSGVQAALDAPNTREATYISGINAPDTKVSPRRSLIVVLGLLIGGFVGLMVLIGKRAWRHIKAHEAELVARQAGEVK